MRVTVLGSGQDGGLPQAASTHDHDDSARIGTIPERTGPSLLIEEGRRSLLCDVSPDFRIQWWNRNAPPDAIALTHAHMGHYAGLVHFGKEAFSANEIPLHASERMLDFLTRHAPWSALLTARNLVPASEPTWAGHEIRLIPVPHRAEFTDTMAVSIGGQVLWLPDIDSWVQWPEATRVIAAHQIAFVDATFWSADELGRRPMKDIAHPLVGDTLERFADLDTRIVLTHLNHTNPLCDPGSPESGIVHDRGFELAADGLSFEV